jgi:uncharacterized protein with PQ loop repeat
MGLFGGDFGLSEFIFRRLDGFKNHLRKKDQKRIAHFVKQAVYFFSIIGPIMTFPQVMKIYTENSAEGLSLVTWSSYLFLAFFWLTYGVFIKNRPIVLANTLWIFMQSAIVAGIIIYG